MIKINNVKLKSSQFLVKICVILWFNLCFHKLSFNKSRTFLNLPASKSSLLSFICSINSGSERTSSVDFIDSYLVEFNPEVGHSCM